MEVPGDLHRAGHAVHFIRLRGGVGRTALQYFLRDRRASLLIGLLIVVPELRLLYRRSHARRGRTRGSDSVDKLVRAIALEFHGEESRT